MGRERERGREGEGGEREKGLSPQKKISGAATAFALGCSRIFALNFVSRRNSA